MLTKDGIGDIQSLEILVGSKKAAIELVDGFATEGTPVVHRFE